MENHYFSRENPLEMATFNSYVKLPEGSVMAPSKRGPASCHPEFPEDFLSKKIAEAHHRCTSGPLATFRQRPGDPWGTIFPWMWVSWVPSGKLTLLWKITIFNGKTHYKWPFSIAMLVYKRVMSALNSSTARLFHWGGTIEVSDYDDYKY
jgi:hypothetical protein